MTEIKRFDNIASFSAIHERDGGDYVLYTDHIAALEAVKAERDDLSKRLMSTDAAMSLMGYGADTHSGMVAATKAAVKLAIERKHALEANQQVIADNEFLTTRLMEMRVALEYIAANDIAYLVAPTPTPKGYPGHYAAIARAALSDKGDAS